MDDRLPRILLLAATWVVVSTSDVAGAVDAPPAYALTAWTTEAGLPEQAGSIVAIAQDLEGYLWLGTSRGLLRFDGFQFVPWGARGEPALPGNAVRALSAGRDGSLWVAYGDVAGVSRIRQGALVHYAEREGLRGGVIQALIEDRRGAVWAAGPFGLLRLQDGAWQPFGPGQGVPHGQVFSLYEDRGGRIWVGTERGVVSKSPDAEIFAMSDPHATFVQGFVEDLSGTLWVTDTQRLLRVLGDGPGLVYTDGVRTPVAGWRLLADSRGAIWVAALGAGLMRVRGGANQSTVAVESFRDSAITGSVHTLFRDRENNIWIGMRGGLLRLKESLVVNSTPLEGLMNEGVRGLTAANDGSVWVATTYALNRFTAQGRQVFKLEQTQALHTDRTGAVWIVTLQGIYRFSDGRLGTVNMPRGLRLEGIGALTSDLNGALWFCDRRAGVIYWHAAELLRFEDVPEIAQRPCGAIHRDRQGRVWIGFLTGGVAVYQGGRFDVYGERDGVGGGNVATILEDRAGDIWIGTTAGISRFEDGRFTTLTGTNGLPQRTASLLEDGEGFLWASGARGLVRFNPREVHRVIGNPSHQMEYTLYDRSDGLPGALASQSRPSAVRSRDGRLWFASASGVSIIEPRRLPGIRGPTSSRVEEVRVDGRAVVGGSAPPVAPHGSTLEIAYSALNLSAASKLRFRFKLDGLEENWNYVDGRRQATFASLPSGTYRFRVAATDDGIWREPDAVFAFTITPPFYRTSGFYLTCVTVMLSLVWGYWQLRLRTVRGRHALVLAERARVSRDIHDTLLQSLTAVGLELEVVARVAGTSHPSVTDTVRDCQRRVAECIRETRQSVWALRSPSLERLGFEEALKEVAANAAPAGSPAIDVTLRGKALVFSHQAQEELLRIVREAIANAVRHGRPRHVSIDLAYEDQAVTLRVTDDGCGFVPGDVPGNGEHCGLRNIRERSAALNGKLRVVSSPGAGTVVEVTIPHGAR